MDEGQAALVRDAQRLGIGLVEHLAVEDDLGAMALGLADLDGRRRGRHDDRGGDAEPAGVIGDRLAVIAGRGGDHAARARSPASISSNLLSAPRSL